jgi:hypothetical protein
VIFCLSHLADNDRCQWQEIVLQQYLLFVYFIVDQFQFAIYTQKIKREGKERKSVSSLQWDQCSMYVCFLFRAYVEILVHISYIHMAFFFFFFFKMKQNDELIQMHIEVGGKRSRGVRKWQRKFKCWLWTLEKAGEKEIDRKKCIIEFHIRNISILFEINVKIDSI